jgi:hypothetical protein
MERVPPDWAERASTLALPRVAPAPRRQVVIADEGGAPPERVVLQTMDEARRTETFRELVGSPPRHVPPASPVVVVTEPGRRADEGAARRVHLHHAGCHPGCSLGRLAVFTGVGAIVGHQFDRRSRGAAIGAGLAILASPWWWGRGCDFDMDDCLDD